VIVLHGPDGYRQVAENTPYRLLPGEKIVGAQSSVHPALHEAAQENQIGVGDLVAAITTSTGFKRWWDKKHNGECQGCKKHQAALNYIQAQAPGWLAKWVKDTIKK